MDQFESTTTSKNKNTERKKEWLQFIISQNMLSRLVIVIVGNIGV